MVRESRIPLVERQVNINNAAQVRQYWQLYPGRVVAFCTVVDSANTWQRLQRGLHTTALLGSVASVGIKEAVVHGLLATKRNSGLYPEWKGIVHTKRDSIISIEQTHVGFGELDEPVEISELDCSFTELAGQGFVPGRELILSESDLGLAPLPLAEGSLPTRDIWLPNVVIDMKRLHRQSA